MLITRDSELILAGGPGALVAAPAALPQAWTVRLAGPAQPLAIDDDKDEDEAYFEGDDDDGFDDDDDYEDDFDEFDDDFDGEDDSDSSADDDDDDL